MGADHPTGRLHFFALSLGHFEEAELIGGHTSS